MVIVSYLRGMKLHTKTNRLSTPEIRKVVRESINWCADNIGKKHKIKTLKYKVLTLPDTLTPAYGMYDPQKNTLYVFRNHAKDVKMVIRSVLHEYTHFMQNLRYYGVVLKKVGYNKHPLEQQARGMEYFYKDCWEGIKNSL